MRQGSRRSMIRSTTTAFSLVMYCTFSIREAAAVSANDLTSSLVTKSTSTEQHRRLQDNNNNNEYEFDLSGFSVHYDKCQYVKSFDDDAAANAEENGGSPLATKQFVLFRLCPSEECMTCDDSSNYGKYVTEVDEYLQYTVNQQKQIFENMCGNCEQCGNNNNGVECYTECGQECNLYGNMEDYGLVDAADYIECQQVDIPDDEGDGRKLKRYMRQLEDEQEEEELQIYIGPKCNKSGARIELGLFSDENCWEPISSSDIGVTDVLQGGELSYYFLDHTYRSNGAVCLTCAEDDQNANQNDAQDADNVNEMCENLYDSCAKCETPTGITAGFIQTKREDEVYENQVETEFLSCSFINSLLWNSYTEKGEIDYLHSQDVYVRGVTPLQGLALALLTLWFGGLIFTMNSFKRQVSVLKAAAGLKPDSRATWA